MHPHASTIARGIPANAGISDAERHAAERLIDACCTVIAGDFDPAALLPMIARLTGGYGLWLDQVRAAIQAADIEPHERAAIFGAFQMATLILYDAADRQRLKLHNLTG